MAIKGRELSRSHRYIHQIGILRDLGRERAGTSLPEFGKFHKIHPFYGILGKLIGN
jgi:hypothetical protein